MNKRIIATLLAFVMVVSCTFSMDMTAKADTCGGLEPGDVYAPSEEEVIKDPILHWAIRAAMNAIQGGVVLTADMVGDKSVRDISYELCAHPEDFEGEEWVGKPFWIENLEGIQYAKSAKLIDIGYTSAVEGKRIADVSPLAELTQLEQLILKQNGIDDISSLETLVNLTLFDVASNDIDDISAVRDMEKLKSLNASFNNLKEADEISGLANLEYLSLSDNAIEELPDLSKLTKVYFLDLSHNKLTDITALAGMKNLQELNLSGNDGITDITPLAGLLKLEKDKTALPDNSKKEDLFAAIEVNKLFNLFNISKMMESDLTNVQKALDAYDELTVEQKTYFDAKRIEAARSNMEKVKNGGEPDYYPEYDVEGEKQPVFSSLEISVVDKYGNPMANVEFSKTSKNAYSESTTKVTTNSVGSFVLKHTALDALWDEIVIAPSGDAYVANPEKITYTVAWGNVTDTVNGMPATGLEELKFTLIPKDEYVDKSDLEKTLSDAEKIEEAYKYTKDSYQKFEAALNAAQKVLDDINATKETVADTTANLKTAIEGLEKTDILTELKLIVKDENGNTFTRPFKFQIRVPGTGAEAWNELSDPYTGTAYLKASPGWADGKEWEIRACDEEPYDIDVFKVTIGVKDGVRYYKTVEGQPVDVDFEKVVIVKLRKDGAPDKENERKPDGTVLEECLEEARQYMAAGYTSASYSVLQTAIKDAEAALISSTATQEDFNAAIVAIKQAEEGLTKPADKSELIKELDMQYNYSEENYTTNSWKNYQEKLDAADAISRDANATQDTVDEACAELVKARNELVRKVDKSELEAKLVEANALKEDDYQSGYAELQQVIIAAQEVYDAENATQSQVAEQVKALEEAMEALVKKPAEVNYDCTQSMFRAKVVDKDGNPIAGVDFTAWIGGTPDLSFKSDANGVITYYTYGPVQYGYTTYVKLADDRYTTDDEHYFTVNNSSYVALIATIDGQPYADGTKLTYVLKEVGAEDPEPSDNILSDKTTFRAKVVDEDGNPLSGIEFNLIPPSWAYLPTKTVTTNANGILEYALDIENDWSLVYKVEIASEEYTLEPAEATFQTGYPTELTYVNGIPLSEMTEAFVLTVKAADKPESTDKVLSDAETFRAKVVDKDGNPVSGIEFNLVVNGSTSGTITSNKDGVIEYKIGMYEGYKTYTVTPNNSNYTFEPGSMEFTLEGYPTKITAVNGTALSEAADELVFTVEGDLPTPPADKVLSDAETFRAKVVDKDGNPISGITFDLVVSGSTSGTITSDNDGVIEYKIGMYEGYKTYTVTPNNSDYIFEPGSMEFTLEGYPTKITAVNGTALLEATDELVFIATEDTSIPPATNKQELDDEIFFSKFFEGKAEDYTAESYKEFEDALSEAKRVYADENATQDEVDIAAENLKNARQGLKEVEKTPVCDKNTIRILVVDEADNKVTEEISFKVGTSTQKSRNGLIEYAISTADSGLQKITVTLNGESVLIGEKTYVIEPKQHEFSLEEYAGDIYISAINGETLNGTKEVKFVLKEMVPEVVDKTELVEKLAEMKEIKQDNYTKNSYDAFKAAIEQAEAVNENEEATKDDVEDAIKALEEVKAALKEVTGMRTLVIPVKDQNGNDAPVNTKFIRYDVRYWVDNAIYVKDGKLEWKLGSYDSGDYEFYLPEDSAYISTPSIIRVHVGTEDGTPVIETINGQPAEEATPQFTITPKGTDTSDILTFRALVKDKNGNALEGITFIVQNGDPEEITSDENGIIEYHVTAWDTDTTMTVRLKEGQGWNCDKIVTFAVIVDPNDENRGIIETIDGKPLVGDEQIVFELSEPVEKPVSPFEDVKTSDYYYDAVLWAVENGVTAGKDATHFAPDGNTSRAEVVTFLWRAAGRPKVTAENPFTDVKETDYYYDAVLWAVENGITAGTTATTFSPKAGCTRAQVITFLWRAAGRPETAAENPFTDVKETDYYYDAVLWAVENGITSGKSATTFGTYENCTRAQVVTFLYNANE